jgi:hypothetical protein
MQTNNKAYVYKYKSHHKTWVYDDDDVYLDYNMEKGFIILSTRPT